MWLLFFCSLRQELLWFSFRFKQQIERQHTILHKWYVFVCLLLMFSPVVYWKCWIEDIYSKTAYIFTFSIYICTYTSISIHATTLYESSKRNRQLVCCCCCSFFFITSFPLVVIVIVIFFFLFSSHDNVNVDIVSMEKRKSKNRIENGNGNGIPNKRNASFFLKPFVLFFFFCMEHEMFKVFESNTNRFYSILLVFKSTQKKNN